MARKRKRRSTSRRTTSRRRRVSFSTTRGRRVSFMMTGRGHRRTAWNTRFARASRACMRKRVKPFTKRFGTCMKKQLRGPNGRRRKSRR